MTAPEGTRPPATGKDVAAEEISTRAGFVTLVGRPNAGKSTLLNALVGEHLAAVSRKVQTTRHRIPGFWTRDEAQIVFVDTPGLLDPTYALQEAMIDTAHQAVEGVDAVYFLVDHDAPSARESALLHQLEGAGVPLFLLLTKMDQVPPPRLETRERGWAALTNWFGRHRISARTGEGIEPLLQVTVALLPEQPFFYPADQLTDLNVRFLAAELVREACYEELGAELPYSVHVEVTEWKEPDGEGNSTNIHAVIHVERESQKGIVIGEGGRCVKAIGIRARPLIEALLNSPVYLSLRVKVRRKWSRRPPDLKFFGYRR
ncbi:MAG TPA: GTPase Era [Gemmatimonadota bacterium]|nr:GTPase Era [Gemmatimonadota bacterium]